MFLSWFIWGNFRARRVS